MNNSKREVGKELINLLSTDEIRRTYEEQRGLTLSSNGCELNTGLAAKADGYVQCTVKGIEKYSARFVELFPGGKLQKVLWHQLAWRYHNDFQPLPYNESGSIQIGHTCTKPKCGAKAHLQIVSRKLNESQKKCSYVYTLGDNGQPIFFLVCTHTPRCQPANHRATPLVAVTDPTLVRDLQAQTEF